LPRRIRCQDRALAAARRSGNEAFRSPLPRIIRSDPDPSQEGFRKLLSTHCHVQSLHWAIEEASHKRTQLYVVYIDFANAFNSVDHEALWRWLQEMNVLDVDLLLSLYDHAH
jgi:hypothetical protein